MTKTPFLPLLSLAILPMISQAADPAWHGPILQWHHDPLTEVTFAWVEEVVSADAPLPIWQEGPAGFGYGDGDDQTKLPGMEGEQARIYLARSFEIDEVPKSGELTLEIAYDDAFVCYINGAMVARSSNLKHEHIRGDVKDGHEAEGFETFTLARPEVVLRKGKNLISIEGHNVRKGSSDLTIDPVLLLNGETLIERHATWKYLAGGDATGRWFLTEPSIAPPSEIPAREESEWALGVRPRGASVPYTDIDIDERPFGKTDSKVFEAKLSKLTPGASYEYAITANKTTQRTGWFKMAPATNAEPITYVTGGDMGTTTAIPVCRVAGREDPLFALVGGDIAYANGRDAYKWYDWLDNWNEFVVAPDGRNIPIIAGIGNHEIDGLLVRKSKAPFYFSLFDLPGGNSNFTVDFGNYMSIVLLDSNHAQKVKSQTGWLGRQLDERKNSPNLFVVYHRPAWGTGIKRNIDDIQDEWCPLFEKYGVDCVFENDHHAYKRSKKIVDGVPDPDNGILYIGDGAWGAALRPITDRALDRVGARSYLERWESKHHLIKVTLTPDGTKRYQAMEQGSAVFDDYADKGTAPAVDVTE